MAHDFGRLSGKAESTLTDEELVWLWKESLSRAAALSGRALHPNSPQTIEYKNRRRKSDLLKAEMDRRGIDPDGTKKTET